jgi:glucose/arabinose dehydrogenase
VKPERWWPAPVLILLLLAASCGGGDGQNAPSPTAAAPATPAASQAATAGPAATVAPQPLAPAAVARVFPALTFVRMTGMYELPDGSNRFLVTEQRGTIRIFDNRPDVQQSSLFLDISRQVLTEGNEEGLLGLAFAPDFARSGIFYVDYVTSGPVRTVIARFRAAPDHASADPASEERLLEIDQPFPNHKGGQLAFGPDGYLYIGMGDGGSANDPGNRAQNLNVLLGKVLRIDVSGQSAGLKYRVPPDNPFAGRADARGEVWAYGLRNPWRFSFDPATGELWAGDVGQNNWEEIDIIRKGGDYGWPQLEGSHCNAARARNCDPSGTVLPVAEYATARPNCAVTGGFVYRGGAIPSLQGAYVYGDYCSGKVWALRYDGQRVTEQLEIADTDINISSFAVDLAGNLYALAHSAGGGGIYKIGGP